MGSLVLSVPNKLAIVGAVASVGAIVGLSAALYQAFERIDFLSYQVENLQDVDIKAQDIFTDVDSRLDNLETGAENTQSEVSDLESTAEDTQNRLFDLESKVETLE